MLGTLYYYNTRNTLFEKIKIQTNSTNFNNISNGVVDILNLTESQTSIIIYV